MKRIPPTEFTPEQLDPYRRSEVLRWTGAAGAEISDPWMPQAIQHIQPDYVVDCEGAHASPNCFVGLQDAVDQAICDAAREAPKRRRYIKICRGHYEGPIYMPNTAPPLLIKGAGRRAVTFSANIDAHMSGDAYRKKFAARFARAHIDVQKIFEQIAMQDIVSTGNSAVLRIQSDDATVMGLSVENTYNCDRTAATPDGAPFDPNGRYARGEHQAVALHVAGADRAHLHNLSLSSFQDTLYLQSPTPFSTARSLVTDCEIEGDVDFIFGQATAFFENCEIRSRRARGATNWAIAPATNIRTPYGFVFDTCRFTHDGKGRGGTADCFLGRQWFEGVRATPYVTQSGDGMVCRPGEISRANGNYGEISRSTLEAVGKCIILRSEIGRHVNPHRPWTDWNGGLPDHKGQVTPHAWNPRFRPVQNDAADFHANLGPWLKEHGLDYADVPADTPWLGVFACDGF